MPNVGTIVRWRSHRHVLRQSVGWFQNDFAGRIANRMMQTAPAVGEATFQTFDALVYATIYLVGALWLLSDTDPRLALPLVVWLGLYVWLVAWTVPRVGKASKAFSDARSAITGRIVDSYTNIQSVKLFAHTRTEEAYAGEAIEHARATFMAQMRVITLMELGLTVINGFLIVAVIGYAIVLWQAGRRDDRHRRRRLGADAAAERDDRLDHVVAVVAVPERRGDPRGHGDDRPADRADRRPRRAASSP